MNLEEKYLTERKMRTFDQLVKALDSVIDNIVEVNPDKAQIKVIEGMIVALQRKITSPALRK